MDKPINPKKRAVICVSFHDLDPEGQGACNDATINLAPGACMDLNCTQNDDCIDLVVNLNGGYMLVQHVQPGEPSQFCRCLQQDQLVSMWTYHAA